MEENKTDKYFTSREKFLLAAGFAAGVVFTRRSRISIKRLNEELVELFLDGSIKAGDGSEKLLQFTRRR